VSHLADKVLHHPADLTDKEQIQDLVANCDREFGTPLRVLPVDPPGGVDILLNNAGLQHVSPLEDFPTEKFQLILSLMLAAPFYLTQAVLPHMKKQRWGRIINIGSVHSLVRYHH
jgi:3-hydroxybutyrate dehydrogenase